MCHLDVQNLFAIVASVLHLGNVTFRATEDGHALVEKEHEVQNVASVSKMLLMQRKVVPVIFFNDELARPRPQCVVNVKLVKPLRLNLGVANTMVLLPDVCEFREDRENWKRGRMKDSTNDTRFIVVVSWEMIYLILGLPEPTSPGHYYCMALVWKQGRVSLNMYKRWTNCCCALIAPVDCGYVGGHTWIKRKRSC